MAAAAGVQAILQGTKPWVRLVSILGFISAGFMILIGVALLALGAAGGFVGELGPQFGAIAVVYPIFGLLYLVPSVYLFQYASRIGQFISGGGQEVQLELALDSQRAFWKFVGILCIIGIVLMVLGMLAAIAIPFMMGGFNRG
jgi:hypothetical protein